MKRTQACNLIFIAVCVWEFYWVTEIPCRPYCYEVCSSWFTHYNTKHYLNTSINGSINGFNIYVCASHVVCVYALAQGEVCGWGVITSICPLSSRQLIKLIWEACVNVWSTANTLLPSYQTQTHTHTMYTLPVFNYTIFLFKMPTGST